MFCPPFFGPAFTIKIHMFFFRLCFDCFSFNSRLSFLNYYGTLLNVRFYISFPVFKKKPQTILQQLKSLIWSCRVASIRVAVIYTACYYCTDDISFTLGIHFWRQGPDGKMYMHTRSKCSRTWHNWHTIIITHHSNNDCKYSLPWV